MSILIATNPPRHEALRRTSRSAYELYVPGAALRASWYGSCKVVAEWVFALAILLLTAPLILLAMALVRLTSAGPVLYSQTRVGRKGRPFNIYKIRTMYHQCEDLSGARWSTPGDKRVTPVGRWLRKTHLDELPQLWNVLTGDMALIGPRPERPEFVPQLEQAIPYYRDRLQVRPGLSGLAQVQLPPDTDLASVRLKLAYDLYYVQTFSFGLEMRIFAATLLHVVGMPFRLIGRILHFPARPTVEDNYRKLLLLIQQDKVTRNGNGTH